MKIIELISPHKTRISGYLTEAGGVCEVTCRYSRDAGEHFYYFEVPAGSMDALAKVNGDHVFVDEHGKRWASGDVMYASTPVL